MLTYEYLYRVIDNSHWMMEQRALSFSKGKCLEMLIPVVSGAIAGITAAFEFQCDQVNDA